MNKQINIETTDKQITVAGDYNSEFVAAARNLGGKWQSPAWVFDIRNETDVRAACMDCYGSDGYITDVVDVEIDMSGECAEREPIEICGRTVARAFGRDSGARLGDGIIVKSGGFTSGGSAKNWRTQATENTVVILRDVSRALVEKLDEDTEYTILTEDRSPDHEQLTVERDKLLSRVAEINALLNNS